MDNKISKTDDARYLVMAEKFDQLVRTEQLYKSKENKLSLDAAARRLGITRHMLSRAINFCLGVTFYEYMNGLRIEEAIRLMSGSSNNRIKVDEIATQSGFNDRKGFHRICKKFTGCSPSELYMKLITNNDM